MKLSLSLKLVDVVLVNFSTNFTIFAQSAMFISTNSRLLKFLSMKYQST